VQSTLTVLTEACAVDLTTLARAKRELGISGTRRDDDLKEDITMASMMCAEYCRRTFAKEKVREVIDSDSCARTDDGWIVLQRKPIVEIHSVVEGTDTALVLDTDFVADLEHGMIRRGTIGSPRYWRYGKLTVEYTAGYELLDGVPWSYERACLIVLRSLWFSRGRDPAIRSVDIPDVGSRTYASGDSSSTSLGLPLEAQHLLQPHRRIL
jgi:hypothetical protein